MKTMLLISAVALFIGTMSIGCDQTSQQLIHPLLEVTDPEPEDTVTDQDVPEPEDSVGNTGGCIDNILITSTASEEQLEKLEKCLIEEGEVETSL